MLVMLKKQILNSARGLFYKGSALNILAQYVFSVTKLTVSLTLKADYQTYMCFLSYFTLKIQK